MTPTYYETPLLQETVWEWSIPTYFYVGGVSGACAAFGAALRLHERSSSDHCVIQRCRQIAAGGSVVSAALLIHDLGVPKRFLYMLRVFRPTSPMSVGTWILQAFGASSTAALLFSGRFGQAAQITSGLVGLPLATYTAVLVSNSAVPVWQASRRTLPFLFAGSALAGAASLLELTVPRHSRSVQLLAVAGGLTEFIGAAAVEREAGQIEEVGKPLHTGAAGALWTIAKLCTVASLVVSLVPGKSRRKSVLSGVLGTAASVTYRFAILQAGRASARNPRATFAQQR